MTVITKSPEGWRLAVRLTPNSSDDRVSGSMRLADGREVLAARVRAVPEKGKANKALEKLIARWAGVAKTQVKVVSGSTSRLKTIEIAGDGEDLAARISQRLAEEQGGRDGG